MTETANDRPAEDAPKASMPPSPGRRNRLAAADARSQRILILVLRAIFVVVLISVVVLTVASNRTSALDFGFSTVVGLLISAAALGVGARTSAARSEVVWSISCPVNSGCLPSAGSIA
jgi:hypothetical protein